MSSIEQIANLLRSQIEQRRTLAIGSAQSASIQGTRALYQTPSGIISAIATNFCYGDCLLAKVQGTWYAINPSDNREVVRSSVDRLIQRRPKVAATSGQVVIIKNIPLNYDGGFSLYRLPSAKLFAHDIRQTSFLCPYGYNGVVNNFPSPGNTYLQAIPAANSQLITAENPCFISTFNTNAPSFNYPISYNQIDLNFGAQLCNQYNCRYLLWFNATWASNFTTASAIYGSVSASTGEYIKPTIGNSAIYVDFSSYSKIYDDTIEKKHGYIDYKWLAQIRDGFTFPRPAELFAYCIQIDTQNIEDITFLTPIYQTQGETVIGQRPQVINS
jgi:hypothetical protein